MTLDDILQHIYSRVNKDQSGNTYNLDRFNNDLQVANLEMFSWYYGLPQGYQPGMPFPKVEAEVTQKVTDSLRHLVVNMGGDGTGDPAPLLLTNGIASIPEDYVHVASINYAYVDKACGGEIKYPIIEVLTQAQWSYRIENPQSIINKKNNIYPYCNFQRNYIQFRPKDIQFVNFVYWRSPKKPVYDYYIDVNDAIIYLPPGSSRLLQAGEEGGDGQTSGLYNSKTVELEWPDDVHPDFANLIYSYVSDNLKSQQMKQSAELRKNQGT